jgi:hypothetical protein
MTLVQHDATPPSTQREVESNDAARPLETNIRVRARSLYWSSTKRESRVVPEPAHVLLGFVATPRRLVVEGHARDRDLRPWHAKASMNRRKVLKVDAVFEEFEQVHPHQSGIVLSAPNETAVVDLSDALEVVWRLRRRAVH